MSYVDPNTYPRTPATDGGPQYIPNAAPPASEPPPPGAWPIQPVVAQTPPGAWPSQPAVAPAELGAWPTQPAVPPADPGAWPTQLAVPPADPGAWPTQPAAPPADPGAWPTQPAVPPADPGAWPTLPSGQYSEPSASWDPGAGAPSSAVEVPAAPQPTTEQWVYVDPSSYSNPYTESPVYTSGPQPTPTQAPPLLVAPVQADTMPTAPGAPPALASDPLHGFGQPQSTPIVSNGGAAPPHSQTDPLAPTEHSPEKGELKIKERRTWKTWQLLSAVLVAAVLGMWINGSTGGSATDASGGGSSAEGKLPPPSGTTATTAAGSATNRGSGSATSTTAAGSTSTTSASGSTSTTLAGGSSASTATTAATTAAPAAVGPATVLVPEVQQTGNWTSPAFTIAGGTWNIGWAFQCVPAPTATPTFQIFVVNNGAAPGSAPAVTSSVASGNAVTPLTSAGSQQVIVQTSAACRWAVKVTGSGS